MQSTPPFISQLLLARCLLLRNSTPAPLRISSVIYSCDSSAPQLSTRLRDVPDAKKEKREEGKANQECERDGRTALRCTSLEQRFSHAQGTLSIDALGNVGRGDPQQVLPGTPRTFTSSWKTIHNLVPSCRSIQQTRKHRKPQPQNRTRSRQTQALKVHVLIC